MREKLLQLLLVLLCASQLQAGTVQGTVTDADTGLPVAGASVWVSSLPVPDPGASTTSAVDGSYSMKLDSSGAARLNSTALGYLRHSRHIDLPAANQTQVEDISLERERFIVGRLLDADSGLPLVGHTVRLYQSGQYGRLSESGEDGRFVFSGLPQIPFGVCVIDAGDAYLDECWEGQRNQFIDPMIEQYTPIMPTLESVEPQLTMVLSRGASLRGSLVDRQTGHPLSDMDARFVLWDQYGQRMQGPALLRTSPEGEFVLEGLLELPYHLSIGVNVPYYTHSLYPGADCLEYACNGLDGEAVLPMLANETLLLPLALHPGGELRGRITAADSGVPLAGIEVRRTAASGFFWMTADHTTTAEDGSYRFKHLPPGFHRVGTTTASTWINQSLPGGPCTSACGLQAGPSLSVGINEVLDSLDIALETGAAIRGRAHRPGLSFGQQKVIVFDDQGNMSQTVYGDRQGVFHTYAWLPGTYYARSTGPETLCESYMGFECATPVTDGTPILLPSPGDVAEIYFDLSVEILQMDGFEE